jgi:RimJ/RimL family protein N-acetyltransferase
MLVDAQIVLRTSRLLLRPFREDDTDRLGLLAADRRIADTMVSFRHPYSSDRARDDIGRFRRDWEEGKGAHFAIALANTPLEFRGYFALKGIDGEHSVAEISFWIDEQATGKGYVREAGHEILRFAFENLRLNRICAYHMVRNPASAKVLAGLGLRQEGVLREKVRKCGVFEDVVVSAILAREWNEDNSMDK